MWNSLQRASQILLASMAFTLAFFLTPRTWISGTPAPSSETPNRIPVDSLEDSDSCLWCDPPRQQTEPCSDRKEKWLSPETTESPGTDCVDETTGTGPNA